MPRKMKAAISHATFIVACDGDSNASPSSSSSSTSLLPPRTPRIALHCSSTTSPTRSVGVSMFEVPLDRPCSDSHVEDNFLLEPSNHLVPTNPSFQHTFFKDNQGRRHRRTGRRRFRALLSLPQGLNKNGDFLSIIGSTGLPMARSGRLQGTGGVYMALVVTLITLLAAAKQGLSMGSNQHQEMPCSMCHGFRFHICSLCKGRGIVEWEGKLRHTDPCPRCFGNCCMKVQSFTNRIP